MVCIGIYVSEEVEEAMKPLPFKSRIGEDKPQNIIAKWFDPNAPNLLHLLGNLCIMQSSLPPNDHPQAQKSMKDAPYNLRRDFESVIKTLTLA